MAEKAGTRRQPTSGSNRYGMCQSSTYNDVKSCYDHVKRFLRFIPMRLVDFDAVLQVRKRWRGCFGGQRLRISEFLKKDPGMWPLQTN